MKIAIYPGSFNPYHKGHHDVVMKAISSHLFDKIIIWIGKNTSKDCGLVADNIVNNFIEYYNSDIPFDWIDKTPEWLEIASSDLLLSEYLKIYPANCVIKGLRNAQDLEYETAQQYWNEDLGVTIPTMFIICDRNLRHISSSAIRGLEKFKK